MIDAIVAVAITAFVGWGLKSMGSKKPKDGDPDLSGC